MDGFFDIVKTWDTNTQVWFFLGCLFVTLCLGAAFFYTLRIVLRGYPPPSPPPLQPCNHDDNLKGVCLKPGGCRSSEECNRMVAKADEGVSG